MIARKWPIAFRALYGGEWPKSYLTLDCETTGFNKNKDVIVEIGHCVVENGKVTSRGNVVLNWADHAIVPTSYVRRRLNEVSASMASQGKTWHMSFERMCAEGVNPEKGLAHYRDLFKNWADSGGLFVAHNGFFDEEMIAHNFAGFEVEPAGFQFPDNQFFDTSSIERGNQLPGRVEALPREGETLRSYFRRLKYLKGGGLESNLDRHCSAKYRFAEKYGVDMKQAHSAGFDAYLAHLLMEEWREQLARPEAPGLLAAPRPPEVDLFGGQPVPLRPPPVRRRGQRNR